MAENLTFGAFFRQTREGLGLSLRAFCHRNGFDAGNVSRIERGLTPPPKTGGGLEKYAKALKLKRGTEPYDRFFDLAAKETGRIPGDLLENQSAADQLPKLLQRLRSGPGHRNWVTARHLNQWADTLAARAVLPQLIRRLVHATGQTVTSITFPAGEQTQRPNLDGVVDAAGHDAFVPLGRSVWEIGVDRKPAEKAEEDFEKRRKQKLGFDKKAATYVFVTPRSWSGKQTWLDAKNKLKAWKEVRVYDSANLEEWLERAPAVDVWLSRQIEIRPEGLSDLDEYWENLASVTEPALTPAVFVASRAKQVGELERWLAGPSGVVALQSRSPSEAVDFAAAVIKQAEQREAIAARTVIVDERNAWRSICRSGVRLVLIAHPSLALEPELVAEAVRQGHHVILSVAQSVTERVLTIQLPRVYRHHLDEALRQSGMERADAGDYAAKAGGSLTVLKRLLAKVRGTSSPPWSVAGEAKALVPMLLAGEWEDQVEGDRSALAELAGRSYEAVAEAGARWLDTPDPPLKRVLGNWSLVSRDDSWHLLSPAVTPEHIGAFEKVALDVLGEDDPAFELPPDERWMANVKGKVLRRSSTLRSGLAETLALLGARSDRLSFSADVQGMVARVVRRVLERQEWVRWASLSRELPLLAEAAPDTFLSLVQNDLRSKSPVLPKLFEQDGRSPLFSSAPHTGLLWALEGLAWDRGELARVSYVLARLDELVGEKKTGNSPMQSLLGVYLPWFPQTTASVEERVKVLRGLADRYPESGWRLLLELLPDRVRHSMPIRRPAFRDWALAWTERVSTADYNRQVDACAEITVELAGHDVPRLKELIDYFENLPAPVDEKLLNVLGAMDESKIGADARRELAEALRAKVTRHRRFKDSDWALPEEALGRLERAQHHLEPADAVSRHAWLFNQIWEVVAHDIETEGKEVAEQRKRAIEAVIAESGWPGVLKLADAVKAPEELGVSVGLAGTKKDDARVLPDLIEGTEQKLRSFAEGYIWGRFQAAGWDWVEQLKVTKWSGVAVAEVALRLPVQPRTWAFVGKKGKAAEEAYWLRVLSLVREPEPAAVREAVKKLLDYGRPFQACFVVQMARHSKCPVDPELAAEALEAGFTKPLAETEQNALGARRHYVIELIQYLQNEAKQKTLTVQPERVAKIEGAYLGLLDGHPAKPVTLHRMLETDPKFFVDLLATIFRSRSDESVEVKEPTADEQARARNAYRLLMSWELVPGTGENGEVNGEYLLDWARRARSLAKEQGRLEVCDSQFGSVLAHSKGDPADGGWPCVAVRDLIEELASDELENGFEVGVYNKRGAYWKAPDEGGEKERDLASRYRAWADIAKVDWPRTAASLQRIAGGYEREASRADAETELRLS